MTLKSGDKGKQKESDAKQYRKHNSNTCICIYIYMIGRKYVKMPSLVSSV